MKINMNENVLNELKITLTYYIKGLNVTQKSKSWIEEIQRMVENALVEYSLIDIRKKNFLYILIEQINEKYIVLKLTNKNNKHSKFINNIKIDIPYKKNSDEKDYKLGGEVHIRL